MTLKQAQRFIFKHRTTFIWVSVFMLLCNAVILFYSGLHPGFLTRPELTISSVVCNILSVVGLSSASDPDHADL